MEDVRSYASISPMFWTRGSGKRLRGDAVAQVVALYLMSAPATTMVGIFHLALPTLCHETGLAPEAASEGLARCAAEGIALWDEAEELVFVPALAKHQIGDNLKKTDNKVKGVVRELAPYKGHRFYDMFVERYGDSYSLPLDNEEGASESLTRDLSLVLSCPEGVQGELPAVSPASPTATPSAPSVPKGKRGWTRFPKDYVPNADDRAIAAQRGVEFEHEYAKILDHEFQAPRKDPSATLRNWLRNARPTQQPRQQLPLAAGSGADIEARRKRAAEIEAKGKAQAANGGRQ